MAAPATGTWGPRDFPEDFRTIDDLQTYIAWTHRTWKPSTSGELSPRVELAERVAIRDCLLDLAEDLDARGLVLCPAKYVAIAEFLQEGEAEVAAGDFAPIDTADADLETGGE